MAAAANAMRAELLGYALPRTCHRTRWTTPAPKSGTLTGQAIVRSAACSMGDAVDRHGGKVTASEPVRVSSLTSTFQRRQDHSMHLSAITGPADSAHCGYSGTPVVYGDHLLRVV